jgi:hypothetical protein
LKKTILLFLVFFCGNIFSQVDNTSTITSLQIAPENPTVNDQIQLTINALWSSGSCEMISFTTSNFGNSFEYNFFYDVGAATFICTNSSTINLGTLAAGEYTITCYINNNYAPSMQYEPMTVTFTVTGGNLQNQNFEQNNAIIAYPNPVTDFLTIENQKSKSVTIFNALGQKIIEKNNLPSTKTELNFSDFPKGIYFLSFENNFTNSLKIIKL